MNTKFLQVLVASLLLALGIPLTIVSSTEIVGFGQLAQRSNQIFFVLSVSTVVAAFWLLLDLSRSQKQP